MVPKNRLPTHPGEILLEEYLRPLNVTSFTFASHIGIPVQHIDELVSGKQGITAETAWLLSCALTTTPQFWMNLQTIYDLASHRPAREIRPIAQAI